MLAEQCIGITPCAGSRKLRRPNTPFFISPAYSVPPIRISFSVKLTAITVSLRLPWRAGSALKLGRLMIVYSGAKPASSSAVGRTSSVRMNRLCHANSLMTRTLTRYSGCAAAEQVGDVKLVLAGFSSARKSALRLAKCSGVIGWLIAPQLIVSSVVASRTMNLSFTLRPVCLPVSTSSGPSLVSLPSPRCSACSTSAAVPRLAWIVAPVAMPWRTAGTLSEACHDVFSRECKRRCEADLRAPSDASRIVARRGRHSRRCDFRQIAQTQVCGVRDLRSMLPGLRAAAMPPARVGNCGDAR